MLDIPLVDHIVIGGNGRYVSMKERGLGFDGHVSDGKGRYALGEFTVIYAYSRAQALADGVLIDVTKMAGETGFSLTTAITANLHATLAPNRREGSLGQSYEGRLWDVLFMAHLAVRRAIWNSQTAFRVNLAACPAGRGRLHRRTLNLWVVVGPGDELEPVITIGFPEDF